MTPEVRTPSMSYGRVSRHPCHIPGIFPSRIPAESSASTTTTSKHVLNFTIILISLHNPRAYCPHFLTSIYPRFCFSPPWTDVTKFGTKATVALRQPRIFGSMGLGSTRHYVILLGTLPRITCLHLTTRDCKLEH
jgi:hypothetical protein